MVDYSTKNTRRQCLTAFQEKIIADDLDMILDAHLPDTFTYMVGKAGTAGVDSVGIRMCIQIIPYIFTDCTWIKPGKGTVSMDGA